MSPSYVRSRQDIDRIEATFSKPQWLYEGLRVEFLTTPEFVRDVLPPGLEPVDEPLGLVSLGRWQSGVCGEFDTGSVFLQARHGDTVGYYNLTMLVSGEMPVVWGREVWGEVKKHGRIGVYRDGNQFFAWAERHGRRLIEIEADLSAEKHDVEATSVALEVKAYPSATGVGLEYDPLLVKLESKARYRKVIEGDATLVMRNGDHDPLGTVPIKTILGASFAEGASSYSVLGTERLCSAEEYMPYFYGRHYDDFLQFPVAARYRRA